MGTISRKQISEFKSIAGEPFFVKLWNGTVNIRKWNGIQRAVLLARTTAIYGKEKIEEITEKVKEDNLKNVNMETEDFNGMYTLMAEAIAVSLCDDNGDNLFDSNNEDDIKEIIMFDAELIQILFEECMSRNGLLEKSLKEEIKNSETIQS